VKVEIKQSGNKWIVKANGVIAVCSSLEEVREVTKKMGYRV